MTVRIKLLPGGKLPKYATDGSAGLDCYATEGGTLAGARAELVEDVDDVGTALNSYHYDTVIDRRKVSLGFAIELPAGHVAMFCPRSGLGSKLGIVGGIGACVVDEDYRGEVSALLFNLSREPFTWKAGERVIQMVVQRYERVELQAVEELAASDRGGNGWGSSGR